MDPLTEKFYSCIDGDLSMISIPVALLLDVPLSKKIANYIRQGDSLGIQAAVRPHCSDSQTKMFPELLSIFLETLTRKEQMDLGIVVPAVKNAAAVGSNSGDGAAEEDGASERGNSNVNSSLSSLSKDEFAAVSFQDHRDSAGGVKQNYRNTTPPPEKSTSPPSGVTAGATPVSSFVGVSLSEAFSRFSELGCPPCAPLLDFYRGVSVRPFPDEGNLHVGDWYVNLPTADVDDLILSSNIVSQIFPVVDRDSLECNPNSIGSVSTGEMWWISKDRVAQSNIMELAVCFFSGLDIKVEWGENKTTAVLISNSSSVRTQSALESSTALSIMVQIASFFEYASIPSLAAATRELLSGNTIG